MCRPHLFVDISAHGLGHLAQTAPVLNHLAGYSPDLRLTIRSGLPLAVLRQRIRAPFDHLADASDFGYAMIDAFHIDAATTAARYQAAHARYETRIAAEADLLRRLDVDAVLANVSYLPLAAAERLGIPAVAMSSLNWADLYAHYFGLDHIHAEMLAAYRRATFLRTTPAMPMPALERTLHIGPIATRGRQRRTALRAKVGAGGTARLVMIALGGVPARLPVERWPLRPDIRWLVPAAWQVDRPDMLAWEPLGFPFLDLLRSVDAVVAKPGYGTFAEAVANGTAVLYQRLADGEPEQDCLIDWLAAHGRSTEVSAAELDSGDLGATLDRCLAGTVPPAPTFDGAAGAARHLRELLA